MQETVSSAQNRRCLSLTENVIWRKVWTKEPTIFPGTSILWGIAPLAALRSKDPNTQVGCCIVSEDNKILSIGYNGFPKGCSDDEFPWRREGDPYDTKYFYTTHSELNAILNYRGGSLEGAKLYVSLFPCNECAKAIIQCGIRTVVYDCDKYDGTPSVRASKRMMNAAGVRYYKYQKTGRNIEISV